MLGFNQGFQKLGFKSLVSWFSNVQDRIFFSFFKYLFGNSYRIYFEQKGHFEYKTKRYTEYIPIGQEKHSR